MGKVLHEGYLSEAENQSCYEYLKECHAKISHDVGEYPAFVSFGCQTEMQQMFADIEKLAAFIALKGFKADDVISVFMPTCPHAFLAFYSLSKLGIIADFIHPLTPSGALEETLEFTKSKGIFILDSFAAMHKDVIKDKFTIICRMSDYTSGPVKQAMLAKEAAVTNLPEGDNVYNYSDIMAGDWGSVPDLHRTGRETAVYMHGSGTTGKSKTVQLSAYALNNIAYKNYGVDYHHQYGKSYSLCILPCFHAFGLGTAMHYCMCNAYTPIMMPKFDAHQANDYISKYNIQYIIGAPKMFRKMYAADNFINPGIKNLTMLYSGGDIVSESFIREFTKTIQEHGSEATLFRGWGLTEMCAVCSTNSYYDYKPDSVGKPVIGVECEILDENRKPLPRGVQGEIALSGSTMMNGYLPDKDLEGNGIWTDENGKDWICTGDMGYLDEDGFIFFTGRKKRIIVISGYNVYPYSMEQKLMTLPFVKELCAVQGYDGDKPLVKLCLTLKNDCTLSEDEVKKQILEFSERELDHFSVPRKIVIMDTLPRTKMEKLDFMKMSDPVPFDPAK